MEELTKQLQELIKRAEKGSTWLDDPSRTEEQIKTHYGEFKKILQEIVAVTERIKIEYDIGYNEWFENNKGVNYG